MGDPVIRVAALVITAGLLLTGCGATTPESDGDTGKTTSEVPKTRSGGGAVG